MSHPSALYICYLSLDDPLVETQVVAYVEGLAGARHEMHLLTFEPPGMGAEAVVRQRERLAARGITWHRATYHKRPSLPATIFDTLAGALRAARLVRRHRLGLLHARSHVPAAMALLVRTVLRTPLLFDIRGLMAEEYVDAGRWKQGGAPFRLTKLVERAALRRAAGAVVLTEGARRLLFPADPGYPVEVIPCCADLDGFPPAAPDRDDAGPVLAYVGKFSGWYMGREMVALFERARARWKDAHFLILTQSDPAEIEAELAAAGTPASSYTVGAEPPDRVGARLAQADAGLALIRPVPSKLASSPTKNAEYLAAGLPLVATAGVGGTDELLEDAPGVVVALARFDEASLEEGLDQLDALLADPETPVRCRAAARGLSLRERGIPSYLRLYARIAAASGGESP